MSLELIIAAGIIGLLFLIFANGLDRKEHYALYLIATSITMLLFVVISKGAIDSNNTCEQLLNTTVTNSTNTTNTTTYNYSTYCYDNTTSSTAVTLYRLIVAINVIFVAYVLYYFVFLMFKHMGTWFKRR